jgi:hypothetical protein
MPWAGLSAALIRAAGLPPIDLRLLPDRLPASLWRVHYLRDHVSLRQAQLVHDALAVRERARMLQVTPPAEREHLVPNYYQAL